MMNNYELDLDNDFQERDEAQRAYEEAVYGWLISDEDIERMFEDYAELHLEELEDPFV